MASDLISRETLLDILGSKNTAWEYGAAVRDMYEIVKAIPAADAVPVVHARWVKMTGMMPPEYHGHYMCSNCEWHMKGLRNSWTREEELSYCPGCGAIMDGGEGDG